MTSPPTLRRRSALATCLGLGAAVATFLAVGAPRADAQLFTATDGVRSAQANFSIVGTDLWVTLENVSALQIANPSQVLTAIFFDISGSPALTPSSIALAGTSTYVGAGVTGPLGIHWAYRGDVNGSLPLYGVGAAGFGIFGPPYAFDGSSMGNDIGGLDYGLVGPGGYDTGHGGLVNNEPYIQNGVQFVLAGIAADAAISNVLFQYGTSLTEPRLPGEGGGGGSGIVPEPGVMSMFAAAALGGLSPLLRRRLVRRR